MRLDLAQIEFCVKNLLSVEPKNIFEIGSRDGIDTFHLSKEFQIPQNQCFIFEAHPNLYENIIKHYPNFNTFNIAISDKTESIKFNAATNDEENPGLSSVLETTNEKFKSNQILVDAWTMEDLLSFIEVTEIDICKIDVEGLTWEVLHGFGKYIDKVKIFQLEVETIRIWKEQTLFPLIHDYLETKGFYLNGYNQVCDVQADVCYINKKFLIS